MLHLDLTYPAPEADLACDEALLEEVDDAGPSHPGVLRCYEPALPYVVLGYGNRLGAETRPARCAERGIPILRRSSGGGTVLLGPGCLAYALVLPLAAAPDLETISGTNRWIMSRLQSALASLLGQPVFIQGHTDLVLGDRKFSGNAQRRRRRALLFHGTFLLDFDLALIEHCLALPERRPEYRAHRAHLDFLVNLHLPSATVKQALRQAWEAHQPATPPSDSRLNRLLAERYARPDWHARF